MLPFLFSVSQKKNEKKIAAQNPQQSRSLTYVNSLLFGASKKRKNTVDDSNDEQWTENTQAKKKKKILSAETSFKISSLTHQFTYLIQIISSVGSIKYIRMYQY